MRIIGGQWRRTKLPVADKPGLRPTPDRVRETLFNWLGQDLSGWRAADAFAGTGVLGFEAASRGAAEVLLVEQDAALVAKLRAIKERLKADAVRVQRGDGVAALRALAPGGVDLVLLDPPFDAARGRCSRRAGSTSKRPRPGTMQRWSTQGWRRTATSRPAPCMRICCGPAHNRRHRRRATP